MKTLLENTVRCGAALPLIVALHLAEQPLPAQTATWTGAGGNTDWNTALNWDIGVPAEGTNAVINAGTLVDYNAPMAATSFGSLTLGGALNLNAGGFVVGAPGIGAATLSGSTARLLVNSGGALSLPEGGLSLASAAASILASGGSIAMSGILQVGTSAGVGAMTNSGGTLSASNTVINPNNVSTAPSCVLVISGGSNALGDVIIRRANPSSQPAAGTEGLVISNGLVNLSSVLVNSGNSFASMFVTGGAVTNTGTFIVGQQTGGNNRLTRFLQTGGLVVSTGAEGVRIGVTNSSQTAAYAVVGGTNLVQRFYIGDGTNGATSITANLTNAASIYVGSGGIVSNLQGNVNISLNNGGLFGASADWSTTTALLLSGGSFTFKAADLADDAHNITLANVVRGPGSLVKAGAGKLTLSATNTYSGATTVNEGVLALASTGSISNSTQISVNGTGILDVSALGSPVLLGSQSLGGSGAVVGSLTALSGSSLRPGGVLTAGTLTLSNGLAEVGGVNNVLDLSDDPTGTIHANDLLNIVGDLNLSGINIIQVSTLNGPLPGGSIYKLIQYTGNLIGDLSNLSLTGVAGSLTNDTAARTISLIVKTTRAPASVVWLGGLGGNAWDTVSSSNWLNGVSRDIFVAGDTVRFDDTGATNSLVTIVGSVGPSSLAVDTASNYTFTGSGSIDGAGGLTKTNAGTLTILTANGYLGATVIGQGTVEAAKLANGGASSSLGAPNNDSTNLVLYGATLRYLGPAAGTDRGATLNGTNVTLDIATNSALLTASGLLTGPAALVKDGPGGLALANANLYLGGTIISNGVLQLNTAAAATTNGITNYSATLRLAAGGTVTLSNVLDFNGTCTVDLNNTAGDTHLNGAWSGNATVNIINQQNASRTFTVGGNGSGGGNLLNFVGTISMGTNIGFLRFNDGGGSPNLGTTNVTIDLGTGSAAFLVRNGGVIVDLGALVGGPNTRLTGRGSGSSGTVVYSIGGKELSTTFAGTITNGVNPTAITKVGSGVLTLTGSNTYSGVTIISNGVLALAGTGVLAVTPTIDVVSNAVLDASARTDGTLALNAGQTLTGEGTIQGSVTALNGATVSPGENIAAAPPGSGVMGDLVITNALVFQAGSTLTLDLDYYQFLGGRTNDSLSGMASVTYGGTLNLSITSIETNSVFKLFSAASYHGAFDAINPAQPPLPNLAWDTTYLTVDGTLRLAKPRPKISSIVVSGTDVVISAINGPAFGNVAVLTSTNVALPLTNWTTLISTQFDGGGGLIFSDPISLGIPARFYLLSEP